MREEAFRFSSLVSWTLHNLSFRDVLHHINKRNEDWKSFLSVQKLCLANIIPMCQAKSKTLAACVSLKRMFSRFVRFRLFWKVARKTIGRTAVIKNLHGIKGVLSSHTHWYSCYGLHFLHAVGWKPWWPNMSNSFKAARVSIFDFLQRYDYKESPQ